jgi:YfiH family protein
MLKANNDIPFLAFPNLKRFPEITHKIFTRQGGCSHTPYHTLNIGFGVGDQAHCVRKNRRIISNALDQGDLVFIRQTHGKKVRIVTEAKVALTGDALITRIKNKLLVIQVADCQPVLLYDPQLKVVANVHSGWRGSIQNILANTVRVMHKTYGCEPRGLIAGIGPSLGPCCAEFINYKTEIPQPFWRYKNSADCFDFWHISQDQLCRAGVLKENISISGLCTRCNPNLFFSYRGERITGRFAAVIGLKGE